MRLNKAELAHAEAVLRKAEMFLGGDSHRTSAGNLWRRDVRAFRYVLEMLKKAAQKDIPASVDGQ